MKCLLITALTGLFTFVPCAMADLTLAPLFADHMVLQRDRAQVVWGDDAPATPITLSIAGQTHKTTAGPDGKWRITLDAIAAGGPHQMVVEGSKKVAIDDILVGELWLASGQSNMNVQLGNTLNADKEIPTANYPQIRYIKIKQEASREPIRPTGKWAAIDPTTAKTMSAVGYYFARDLHKELNVPIGIVNCAWAGTAIEAWTPLEAMVSHGTFKDVLTNWDKRVEKDPAKVAASQEEMKRWQAKADEAKKAGAPAPPKPSPVIAPNSPNTPGILYSSMIKPLAPQAFRGVVWYQGESNVDHPRGQYEPLLRMLIQQWRQAFDQKEMPFLIVQLPNFADEKTDNDWAGIREAQRRVLRLPATGLVVTIDVGDSQNLHPKRKEPIGHRLALLALGKVYGKQIVYSGPICDVRASGSSLVLEYTHVGGGLTTTDGEAPRGFEIAAGDMKWQPAKARIDGNRIILTSPDIDAPTLVRYAYANDPQPPVNLTNEEGLPAMPFLFDGRE